MRRPSKASASRSAAIQKGILSSSRVFKKAPPDTLPGRVFDVTSWLAAQGDRRHILAKGVGRGKAEKTPSPQRAQRTLRGEVKATSSLWTTHARRAGWLRFAFFCFHSPRAGARCGLAYGRWTV